MASELGWLQKAVAKSLLVAELKVESVSQLKRSLFLAKTSEKTAKYVPALMARQCFGKVSRLLTAHDYKAIFDGPSKKTANRHFLILYRKNSQNQPRLGLIVAKKHVKLAVQRNRIKRIIRETFRKVQCELSNYDIVVLVKKNADTLDNETIHLQLNKLWQQILNTTN